MQRLEWTFYVVKFECLFLCFDTLLVAGKCALRGHETLVVNSNLAVKVWMMNVRQIDNNARRL